MKPETGHGATGHGFRFLIPQGKTTEKLIQILNVILLCQYFFLSLSRCDEVEHLYTLYISIFKGKREGYFLTAAAQDQAQHNGKNESKLFFHGKYLSALFLYAQES